MRKLNNKGFAISAIVYSLLILFIIFLFAVLSLLANRKVILDKAKKNLLNEINGESNGSTPDSADASINDYVISDLIAQYDGSIDFRNNKWSDLTGNGYTGTISGFDKTSGKQGNAIYFDGENDSISIPRMIAKNFTIEVVFSTTKGLSTDRIFYKGAGLVGAEVSGVVNDFGLSINANGEILAGHGSSVTKVDTTLYSQPKFNNGNIQSATFVRDANTGKIYLYANGSVEMSIASSNVDLVAPTSISIGKAVSYDTYVNGFKGNIYSVRIYDAALGKDDIAANYEVDKKRYQMNTPPVPAPKK